MEQQIWNIKFRNSDIYRFAYIMIRYYEANLLE